MNLSAAAFTACDAVRPGGIARAAGDRTLDAGDTAVTEFTGG